MLQKSSQIIDVHPIRFCSVVVLTTTLFLVRPAWAQSNGFKSLTRPSSGKCIA